MNRNTKVPKMETEIINKSNNTKNTISGGTTKTKSIKSKDNEKSDPVEKMEIVQSEIKDNDQNIFQASLLHSPYIETSLRCPIMLTPTQMDNKLQLHLKSNLNNTVKGRCYLNYGHIIKINKIEEISDGVIEEEDSTCSAKFIVKFSCRLCFPAKNREIICKIDRMNKALISGINGPIKAIITPDKINKDKFFTDNDRNIRIKSSSVMLESDMYIKVLILASTFNHYDVDIIVISYLQDMATDQEISFFQKEQQQNQN